MTIGNAQQTDVVSVKIYRNVHRKLKEQADKEGRRIDILASEQLAMNLERYDKIAALAPSYSYSVGEDFIAVRCVKENKTYTVSLKDHELYCDEDKKQDCIHVIFALATPEANKIWIKKPRTQAA